MSSYNSSLNSNMSSDSAAAAAEQVTPLNWGVLALSLLILATMMGNVLVCLAVCWESRLQNMTNYFLMSLAIADLLVATLVMPLGMIVELYGYFPFGVNLCVIWLSLDVSMCTASIWHMCTMSMDRYFTLKYPMKYGRNKTKTMVALKIAFVWIVSVAISSPVLITGFSDNSTVLQGNMCLIDNPNFLLYGSIVAFYIPLIIMVATYILTIKILCRNQKLMEKISKEHTQLSRLQKGQNGCANTLYANTTFLSPDNSYSRYSVRPSFDASAMASISREASINDVSFQLGDSKSKDLDNLVLALKNKDSLQTVDDKLQSANDFHNEKNTPLLEIKDIGFDSSHRNSLLSSLSASQPNLLANSNFCLNAVRRSSSCRSRNNPCTPVTTTHLTNVSASSAQHNTSLLNPHNDKSTAIWNAQSQPNLIGPSKSFPLQASHSLHKHKDQSNRVNICNMNVNQQMSAHSQPHLPSMNKGYLSPMGSPITFQFPSIKRINSILDLESVKNYDCISACSSVNSCQSMWSDFERPVMLEKLSKIEAEMDLCIMENSVNEESDVSHEQPELTRESCSSPGNSLTCINEVGVTCGGSIPPVCISSPTPSLSHETSPCRSTSDLPESPTEVTLLPNEEYPRNTSDTPVQKDDYFMDNQSVDQSLPKNEPINNVNNYDITYRSDSVSPCKDSCLVVNTTATYGTYLSVVKPNSTNTLVENNVDKRVPRLKDINKKRKTSSNDSNKSTGGSSTDDNGLTSDDCLSDTISMTTQTTYTAAAQHISPKFNPLHYKHAPFLLRTLSRKVVRKCPQIKLQNGSATHQPTVMSKRTANNERKASKVLGIIFAVFVLLWTPFFIFNILAGICTVCLSWVTPAVVTILTWFGYTSSLANPIIYTMFNTAFRKAFYKILTCQYKFCIGYNRSKDSRYNYKYSHYKPSTTCNKTMTKTTSPSRIARTLQNTACQV